MLKCFEIKPDSKLYNDYFAFKEDESKVVKAYEEVCEKFGIETDSFYLNKNNLQIVPTENDRHKFSDMMKKSNYGEFKKNSEPSKLWRELVENIENMRKPQLMFYFRLTAYHWKEKLFHIGDKLYCSFEFESGRIFPEDFAIEMKASDFYKVIEDEKSAKESTHILLGSTFFEK